jgi:beta-glucosidase
LKNENRLLPLSKSLQRIAVIGPNADAARYGDYAEEVKGARVSMLTALRSRMPGATIAFDNGKEIEAAIAKTKDAEVIILGLGERRGISGEGRDRSLLDLPDNQEALLEAMVATGKPVVLVLQNGRPLAIQWAATHVPAILEAWYPAEFGGTAIIETLFGDYNPAGRLTVSFPKAVGQLPDFYNHDPSKRLQYIDSDGKPLFPFGHGLSYTTFEYDQLSVTPPAPHSKADTAVTVRVKNTGTVAGDEVVQIYFREHVATVETPVKSLGAFSRIHLEAGEQRSVTLSLRREQFAVWNRTKQWTVEPGKFVVWVGGSSEATLSAEFLVSE